MAREIEWVTPDELIPNWANLSKKEKMKMEEEQYRKQLYISHYGD